MTETSEQRIECVARAIYQSLYGKQSDDDWQKLRDFYLDPHSIRMGGQSMPFTAARAADAISFRAGWDAAIEAARQTLPITEYWRDVLSTMRPKDETP